MSNDEMVHPYCGGCGHRFFGEPKIPADQAAEQAKTRKCHYCVEDEQDERERSSGGG